MEQNKVWRYKTLATGITKAEALMKAAGGAGEAYTVYISLDLPRLHVID